MKQLLIIILAAFALTACNVKTQAQIRMYVSTTGAQSAITTATSDTLTNADSTWFNVPTGALNKYTGRDYIFYFTLDTTSGSTITGAAVVAQGSYDGVSWFNLSGGKITDMSGLPLGTDGNNCDSLVYTISNLQNEVNRIYEYGGTAKWAVTGTPAAGINHNLTPRVTYARLKFVNGGTNATRIYNVYCIAKP